MFILRVASPRHAATISEDLLEQGFSARADSKTVYIDEGLDRLDDLLMFTIGSDIPYYRYVDDLIPIFGRARDIEGGVEGLRLILEEKRVLVRVRPAKIRDEVLERAIRALEGVRSIPETKEYDTVLYILREGDEYTFGLLDAEREALLRDAKKSEDEHISRAYFKIQEAFARVPYALRGKTAVDIGAAPGGWSEYLVERGARVIAVDPADMDARLEHRMAHLRMDARDEETARMVERVARAVDVITCDVNADPRDVARTLAELYIPILRKHGRIVMTVKYTRPGKRARERMLEQARKILEDAGVRILWEGQLLANTKNEATIVGEKK